MTTKNIFKIMMMLLGVIVLGITSVSCGDDDDDNISKESIIGKWYYEKKIVNGVEDTDIEFECNTKKDYVELLPGGKWKNVYYDKECKESVKTNIINWTLFGKTLTLSYSNEETVEIYTIKNLTANTMVLHYDKNIEDGKEELIDFDEDGKKDDITIILKKAK